ncbi:RIP metalloprotease [Chloroflexota bacterium]
MNNTIILILQLVIAISALIILHEIGHFAAARFFKIDVEEFGIGFPPRALRLWRRKSKFKLGATEITVPIGRRVLQDLEVGQWVDITTKRRDEDDTYLLKSITILERAPENMETKREITPDGLVHMRGEVTSVNLNMFFSLNWLPFGGFVRIKGEGDTSIPDGIAAANPWVRIGVYFAGPLANLLLGVILYAYIISQVGSPILDQVIVSGIAANSPAEAAGLHADDLLLKINSVTVDSTDALRDEIYANLGQPIDIVYERGGVEGTVTLVPRTENEIPTGEGAIGIQMSNPLAPLSVWQALPMGAQATLNQALLIVTIPGEIIKGSIAPEMARPVGYKGIYDMYEYVAEEDPMPDTTVNLNVVSFFAMISVSLGIFNLLPIPALDGGRILFALPEIFIRRRIPIEWQNAVNFVFFMALIALFLYINVLDFTNPINLP